MRALDGSKVLVKLAENPFAFAKRCRLFFGGPDYSDYTIEADVRAMERRRQMRRRRHRRAALRDGALREPRAPRAAALAAGNAAHASGPFPWKADTWYTMKLEVQSHRRRQSARARQGLAEGRARAGGMDDRTHRSRSAAPKGAPGLYADAPSAAGGGSEIYYDNIKVYKNKGLRPERGAQPPSESERG